MVHDPLVGQGPPHYRSFTTTLRHTTLGRTPLDEWSARRRELYLTAHNTHKRQIFIELLWTRDQPVAEPLPDNTKHWQQTFIELLWTRDQPVAEASTWQHTTLSKTDIHRTPLDKGSARRRDLYLTTHSTHNRQTSMYPVGFEPAIPASLRSQTHALDHAATRTRWRRASVESEPDATRHIQSKYPSDFEECIHLFCPSAKQKFIVMKYALVTQSSGTNVHTSYLHSWPFRRHLGLPLWSCRLLLHPTVSLPGWSWRGEAP